jgi:hypothetical protein
MRFTVVVARDETGQKEKNGPDTIGPLINIEVILKAQRYIALCIVYAKAAAPAWATAASFSTLLPDTPIAPTIA